MLAAFLLAATLTPQQEVQRQCSRCHPLAVVRRQRLSTEEWDMELRKMEKLGAKLKNRAAVLAYLSAKFGEQASGSAKK